MIRFHCASVVLLAIVLGPLSARADGPFDRYEVGRRLREFEAAWDLRDRDMTARSTVSGLLQRAVKGFFAGRMPDAGKNVTEALLSLDTGPDPPPPGASRWAESLFVKPESRLLDLSATELPITVGPYYPGEPLGGSPASVRVSLAGSRVEAPMTGDSLTLTLPLKPTIAGDHVMLTEILVGGKVAARNRQTISLVERRDARLATLQETLSKWPSDPKTATADRESARAALERLRALAARRTPESDVPAARILAELEEQARAVEAGTPFLDKTRSGQFWVAVPRKAGGSVSTRLFVPAAAATGKPLPLVVALHGAGGSENMFFETYGHGAIVDRCKERGWMLVAPRSGFFGSAPIDELVDELAKIYPIDPKRVMLVGHSMGAAQAIGAAQTAPRKYAAVAALGGGGSVRAVPGLAAVPFFVGVGTDDFARDGARRLAESLRRAKVANVQFREYEHVEHLAIVQISLGDVFRFFDHP